MKNGPFVRIPEKFIDRVLGNYNPVVIITTRSPSGTCNAAPFAMCMEVCHNPPLLAFGVGNTKDTYRNVAANGEFVINVPGQEILRNLMVTAIRYPPEVCELDEAHLHALPGMDVKVSRVKECRLHFECRVEWIREAGNHFVVLGKVVAASADSRILDDDYRLKFDRLKPVHYVGRGTDTFLETGKMIRMKREPLHEPK